MVDGVLDEVNEIDLDRDRKSEGEINLLTEFVVERVAEIVWDEEIEAEPEIEE